ncbi:hypothetical protein CS8_022690 [Cupriavidus sp. 8B]
MRQWFAPPETPDTVPKPPPTAPLTTAHRESSGAPWSYNLRGVTVSGDRGQIQSSFVERTVVRYV